MKKTTLHRISIATIWIAFVFQIIVVWFHAFGIFNGDCRLGRLVVLLVTAAMGTLVAVFIRQQHKINTIMKDTLWWERI